MKSVVVIAIAKGCDLADGLLNGGEAGLLHLRTISQLIGRKIRVCDSGGKMLGIFGQSDLCKSKSILESQDVYNRMFNYEPSIKKINEKYYKEKQISANWLTCKPFMNSYLELKYQYLYEGKVRHWLPNECGYNAEELNSTFNYENNCLFEAICQQCHEFEPKSLRVMTADALRNQTIIVENAFPQFKGAGLLLLGGAKYTGRNANDASIILDNSQGTAGHGHYARAHPRGHASYPNATGSTDSVENYSRSATQDFPKSAWMSREEQNESIHRLLLTQQAQNGMESLNRKETRIVIKMNPGFDIQVGLWAQGVMFRGPLRADMVTIILQHHSGRYDDSNADVQVFTCYPMAPRGSENVNTALLRDISLKRSHPTSENQLSSSSDDEDDDEIKRARR